MAVQNVVFQPRQGTSQEWESRNRVLLSGEQGYETDTGKFKLGDGVTRWNDLLYFTPNDGTAAVPMNLDAHINSLTPHPVYDNGDGPSFLLLYMNAKV